MRHVRHGFEDKTEMIAMIESAQETNDMLLVRGISLCEFIQNIGFFLTSFVPVHPLLVSRALVGLTEEFTNMVSCERIILMATSLPF